MLLKEYTMIKNNYKNKDYFLRVNESTSKFHNSIFKVIGLTHKSIITTHRYYRKIIPRKLLLSTEEPYLKEFSIAYQKLEITSKTKYILTEQLLKSGYLNKDAAKRKFFDFMNVEINLNSILFFSSGGKFYLGKVIAFKGNTVIVSPIKWKNKTDKKVFRIRKPETSAFLVEEPTMTLLRC